MVIATGFFATLDALVKWLAPHYPVGQLIFFRSAFGLLPLVPPILLAGPRSLGTKRPLAHVLRSLIGLGAIAAFFIALGGMPLAQVIALCSAAPILMTALSVPLLGEKVGPWRWIAVALGLAGVLVILQPSLDLPDQAAAAALIGTMLYALAMVLMRDMGRTESSATTAFWFTMTCMLASAATLPWQWSSPDLSDLALLAATGLVGGLGQLFITQAVRIAPVSVIAPFDYLHIVYAVVLGWTVWSEVPTPATLVGSGVVVGCGLFILWRERERPLPVPPVSGEASPPFPPEQRR